MPRNYPTLLDLVGDTPIVRLDRISREVPGTILAKLEFLNPGGSNKDRIGLAMIEAAEREGKLRPGGTIVEPTSGNTGIGLAMVAAVKGYKLILVMPESMSVERRRLMLAYGASFDLTPREGGMKAAIARPTPVLPEVGSTIVPPGFSFPSCSAFSIIASPMRSLTEPPGLRYSSFASRSGSTPRPIESSRTIGVRPTSSRTVGYSRATLGEA